MKRVIKCLMVLVWAGTILLVDGCMGNDPNTVIDKNIEMSNQNWSYADRMKFDVKIDDASAFYNIYFNLRITADYKYANLFVLIHQTGPDKKTKTIRQEYTLANPDGEWLGDGSGNLYNYQIPSRTHYKFPAKGVYHFEIEQNMRDNPLHEVSDVGLRVEKVQ
ncbi:gliding motility lipoprotein GldH [uncultured Mucilaginibacter sp.]|uniref:gliding motility lipoprotein GldH n=1 Tax=uncultured Mucilaginibacter sp. TaxID=797541 RepID=UPI0025CECD06|nr:gliding motility lipoprotein GldH [uncultured Mucilaginibacter sp.]